MAFTSRLVVVCAFALWTALCAGLTVATAGSTDCFEGNGTKPDDMIAACTSLIEHGRLSREEKSHAFNSRGAAHKVKGELDLAVADFDEAIRLDSENVFAISNRGAAWSAMGDFDRAITAYSAAIKIEPAFVPSIFNRGRIWHWKGDYPKAIDDFSQVLRLQKGHAGALNGRCRDRAIIGQDLKAALSDCNVALSNSRNMAEYFQTRGFVRYKMQDYAKALADLDKAVALDPKAADSWYIRGLAKRHAGREAEGRADVEAGLRLDPNVARQYAEYGVQP